MATRAQVLNEMAAKTGGSYVQWENHARVNTKTPGRNNTAIGRGNQDVHLGPAWIGTVFLSGAIGDPKSSPTLLPLLSGLVVHEQRLTRSIRVRANELRSFFYPDGQTGTTHLLDYRLDRSGLPDGDFFDVFKALIGFAAIDPALPMLDDINIALSFGSEVSATLSYRVQSTLEFEERVFVYFRANREQAQLPELGDITPIGRGAFITAAHIKMLGGIYADSLRHTEAAANADLLTPSTGSAATPENENAGSPGREPASRIRNRNSAVQSVHSLEPSGKREASQSPSRGPLHHKFRESRHDPRSHSAHAPCG